MKWRVIYLVAIVMVVIQGVSAQYTWKLRDPLDLDVLDFGDNKLLLYNGIGIGLSLLLDRTEGDSYISSRHLWEVSVSAYRGYRPDGDLWVASGRRRYDIRKYLSIGIEGRLIMANTDEPIGGIGVSPTFTWYLVRDNRWRLAYDNGVGPNLFFTAFPSGGTQFNFTTFYGLRVEHEVGDGRWIHLSIHNLHISNAEIRGRERNPPFDAVGISLGVSI